jgi:hypothetical protein
MFLTLKLHFEKIWYNIKAQFTLAKLMYFILVTISTQKVIKYE